MKIYDQGIPYQILGKQGIRGMAGPDGNPIGTIISYMGVNPPEDYLICDGSAYSVYEYRDLADFFEEQFGDQYYFGGNNAELFCVPDMRNLFLRGYHGEASEELSGEVGKKQEGTEIPNAGSWQANYILAPSLKTVQNEDTQTHCPNRTYAQEKASDSSGLEGLSITYTTRPVNMAVLYCIKSTKAEPYEEVYSEEETVIGRWIDGKPVYRKCMHFTNIGSSTSSFSKDIYIFEDPIEHFFFNGSFVSSNSEIVPFPSTASNSWQVRIRIIGNNKILHIDSNGIIITELYGIFKYTKVSDDPIIVL